MRKILFSLLVVLGVSFIFLGASCITITTNQADGGVFKSIDKAQHWEQKIAVLSVTPGAQNLSSVDAVDLALDPQDSQVLYLATKDNGLFLSLDSAFSWQSVNRLPKGVINSIALDPKNRNVIYVGMGNRVYKSGDCCRSWQNIYLDATPVTEISSLAVDMGDVNKIYAGLSDGRLLRSANAGLSWSTINDFKARVKKIYLNPRNTGIVYVLTTTNGIWRSGDGGSSWQSLDSSLAAFPNGRDVLSLVFDQTKPDAILTISPYGILRSDDGGSTWTAYKLLSQPGKIKIYSFGLNPRNTNEIYYTTNNSLERSVDGGQNWQTKKLPSKRLPVLMLVNPEAGNEIYVAFSRTDLK